MCLNNKRLGEVGNTNFHYPKHHTGLKIYSEKIRFHGSPDGFTTEHTENTHKDVKDAYRRGNKKSDYILRVYLLVLFRTSYSYFMPYKHFMNVNFNYIPFIRSINKITFFDI